MNTNISTSISLAAVLVFAVVANLSIGCKSQQLISSWEDGSLAVDGNFRDWEGKPTTFFDDQQAVVALSNDSEFLYIQFRTKDAKWAGAIRRAGLMLYIDTEGGKDKEFYVKFYDGPKTARGQDLRGRPDEDLENAPPDRTRFEPASDAGERRLMCFVKDRIEEMPIAPDGSHGPVAAYDTCWGFYCWEFAIPLEESTVRHYGINSSAGKTISIGAVWGDMDEMRKSMPPNAGGDGPERGMPPGGDMPPIGGGGGFPGGGRPGGHRMPEKQEIWFKTTLASPAEAEQETGRDS